MGSAQITARIDRMESMITNPGKEPPPKTATTHAGFQVLGVLGVMVAAVGLELVILNSIGVLSPMEQQVLEYLALGLLILAVIVLLISLVAVGGYNTYIYFHSRFDKIEEFLN